jgi:hypothetical protein
MIVLFQPYQRTPSFIPQPEKQSATLAILPEWVKVNPLTVRNSTYAGSALQIDLRPMFLI